MLSTLNLVTWNLWFGGFERDRRLSNALEIVRRRRPDVIAFQEVVPATLAQIWATPWIRDGYHVTDTHGETFGSDYGTVMMSRDAPQAVHVIAVPSQMDRRLIAVDLLVDGSTLRIGGMHLESLDSTATRVEQLHKITSFLAETDGAVLMGDMNFDDGDPEHDVIPDSFQDLWRLLRPSERGATRDTAANMMAALDSTTPKTRRSDRIYLKGGTSRWRLGWIDLIGTRPIDNDPTLFPSDHFGLVAQLKREEPDK